MVITKNHGRESVVIIPNDSGVGCTGTGAVEILFVEETLL
jgi:hypothetical protein